MTTNAEWMLKQGMKFSDLKWGYLKGKCIVYYDAGEHFDELYSEKSVEPKNIILKWLDAEHVEQILDDVEKRYLSAVIRPFRDKVQSIKKFSGLYCFDQILVYYEAFGRDLCFSLPPFEKGTMYKGMESDKKYSLEELGL